MIVIILNGPAEVGKGTLVKFIEEIFNVSVYKYSSIAWAKGVMQDKFGWLDGKKTPLVRDTLAALKQLGITYDNIPFKKVISQYYEALTNGDDVFITDVREPEEINKLTAYFKDHKVTCLTIRVMNVKKEKEAKILSETGDNLYAGYTYDLYIDNNQTKEDFKANISRAMSVYFP